jgi:hypothetical protein
MGIEYKIQFIVPESYDPSLLLQGLPSPVAREEMAEIYNYAIEPDGFYFIDHLVDKHTSSIALRTFIDAALSVSESIRITEL